MLSLSSEVYWCLFLALFLGFGLQVLLKVVLHLYLQSFHQRGHCKVSSLRPGDIFVSVFSPQTDGCVGVMEQLRRLGCGQPFGICQLKGFHR